MLTRTHSNFTAALIALIALSLATAPAHSQRKKKNSASSTPVVEPAFDESVLEAMKWRLGSHFVKEVRA